MMRRELPRALLALAAAVVPPRLQAGKGPLLTITGRLQRTNDPQGSAYLFTEQEFLGLPEHTITTGTTWTPVAKFTGPRLADVLAHVQASPGTIRLSALNDYTVDVPWSDLARYAPVLALSRDGQRMSVAKYGPLWLMYPRDDFPDELRGPAASAKFIWQVHAIEVI